ncbi:MAG: tRNA (adenosine(37)-N6)-threonylcarbamoyltransferase complex dimerization subunit type 1 TsaB [Eubacteriales bacterium]|nr:tRNA (adenosine(37)-N6)-threonylcarbamoyltransferase complex dimerization subunit type 1 TsaB [Eubacteriales bacterium]
MKILAIEASGPVAGCAVLEDGVLIADYNVQYKKKHAQSLVPMMDEIKRMLDLDLRSVDAIAVTKGPGSFTGLRIGAATAKGAALAMDRPVIPVPTVDSIAYNLYGTDGLVCPLMDARRQQVYTGIYAWEQSSGSKTDPENSLDTDPEDRRNLDPGSDLNTGPGSLKLAVLRPQCVVPVSAIIDDLNTRGRSVVFLGDGVPVSRNTLAERMEVPYSFAPAHLSRQRAAAVAALAYAYYQEQGDACMVTADDFRPEYLRLAQAEQEHSERRNFSLLL